MNCNFVQEQLSAYIDNELGPEVRQSIHSHLEDCESCRGIASQFLALGNLMRQPERALDTEAVWERVAARLDDNSIVTVAAKPKGALRNWIYGVLATAAAIGLLWFAMSRDRFDDLAEHDPSHSEHQHILPTVDLQDVFQSVQNEPTTAIAKLSTRYQGQELNQVETIAYLGYEPALFRSLPAGFTRTSTHVLNMPCCKCSATICTRSDGSSLVVFEHKDEQPVWLGDAATIETQCAGQPCKIVESARKLAVSWKYNDRQLTLIGANDLSEVSDWVSAMKL